MMHCGALLKSHALLALLVRFLDSNIDVGFERVTSPVPVYHDIMRSR